MKRITFALLAFGAMSTSSHADEDHGWWWRQRAKAACISDVMRLCRSDVPNEDKVRSCMVAKKAQVSEGCAEFFPGGKNY